MAIVTRVNNFYLQCFHLAILDETISVLESGYMDTFLRKQNTIYVKSWWKVELCLEILSSEYGQRWLLMCHIEISAFTYWQSWIQSSTVVSDIRGGQLALSNTYVEDPSEQNPTFHSFPSL